MSTENPITRDHLAGLLAVKERMPLLLSKRMRYELDELIAQASAQQHEPLTMPSGWRIERSSDRIVVQQLPTGAGYSAAREGESGIAESVLYLLADALLTAQAAQPSTSPCLWKREQDSGIYETGCGQTWAFTDGTTPDENSACFCHHCGGFLQVQQLIAYQVGDNDIVAAYDPEGAIEVLSTYCGYAKDEFTTDDVVLVNDETLDATEAFDQDEGKTIPLDKTLRQELAELTEPSYLYGWE